MDTEVVKCAEKIRIGGNAWRSVFKPCDKRGTLEHDGKHWCKTHHPPTREAKRNARYAQCDAKWAAENREREQKARDAADIVKFRALAKRAATVAVGIAPDNLGSAVRAILDELIEMHKEE